MRSARKRDGRFGLREFQLALLDRMHEETTEQSEAAMRQLGATRADAAEAEKRRLTMGTNRKVVSIGRWSVNDLSAILGDPLSTEQHPRYGMTCRLVRWELPVWPELWFEVLELPDGSVLNEQLVRRPGAPSPRLETVDVLKPWSCTFEEFEDRFGPLDAVDGMWPCVMVGFTVPDATGEPCRYAATFVWGLLQRVYEWTNDQWTARTH